MQKIKSLLKRIENFCLKKKISAPLPLSCEAYNAHWEAWPDFIKYNPGARHRRRLVIELMKSVGFKTCLDVGCGNAELLMLLKFLRPNARYSGVDLSSLVIEQNRVHLNDIDFNILNIEEAKLDTQFDLIICSEVIEHLGDHKRALDNLSGMLNPNGHLILTCPTGKIFPTEKVFGHTHHPTVSELRCEAARKNLEVVKVWNWGWPTYRLLKMATNVQPDWALKNFASGIYSWKARFISDVLFYLCFLNFRSFFGCQLFVLLKKN